MHENAYTVSTLPYLLRFPNVFIEMIPFEHSYSVTLFIFKWGSLEPMLRRDEVTGDWRKLHNEELHNLYSSPNIIRMIKQELWRRGMHTGYWLESQKERDH
jgi:hypothetical protein